MKCNKVKNPCKICFQPVTHKNGLQCQGACHKWAHFKCLNYTPGKIQDIKAGAIKITCPCPDCNTGGPKEILTDPPYTCTNTKCPANKLPVCTSVDCPSNEGNPIKCCSPPKSPCPRPRSPCPPPRPPCQPPRSPCQPPRSPCPPPRSPCQPPRSPCQPPRSPCQPPRSPCETPTSPCQPPRSPCPPPRPPCLPPKSPCPPPKPPCKPPKSPCPPPKLPPCTPPQRSPCPTPPKSTSSKPKSPSRPRTPPLLARNSSSSCTPVCPPVCPPSCPSWQKAKNAKKSFSPRQSQSCSNMSESSSSVSGRQFDKMRTISSDSKLPSAGVDPKMLFAAIESLCNTVGELSNQLRNLMCEMQTTGYGS